MAALGRFGVQARHLRAVRAAAEREITLIEQVVAPTLRQRSPQARQQAGRTAREIAALTLRLHRALIEAGLAEAGLAGDGLPTRRRARHRGRARKRREGPCVRLAGQRMQRPQALRRAPGRFSGIRGRGAGSAPR